MAFTGIGVLFRRWNSGTGAWDNISEIVTIGGPTFSRETIDATTLDTTGGYREFITGLRDAGEITMTLNFAQSTYQTFKDDFEDDTAQNYEIVLPDADVTSFEFEGLVTACPITIPEAAVQFDVTIKISGQVTMASGSGPSAGA